MNTLSTDKSPRLSVVIPTFNRPAQLQTCLHALADGFPEDAEVIVVSDGGSKALFPDLGRFHRPLGLTVIHVEHGGPAYARNRGLELVRAPVVVFIDDDCLPQPRWLERLAEKVSLDPPIAVGGKTINGLPHNIYAVAAQLVLDLVARYQRQTRDPSVFYPSNNIAFPTREFRHIGGFNNAFRTSEDREVCRRWLASGYRFAQAPDAVLAHAPQLTLGQFWRQFVAYGEGAAQFHDSCAAGWRPGSLAFHLRVPALVAAEFTEQNSRRRLALTTLLVAWELANLLGFAKGKWNKHKALRAKRGFTGRET